MSNEYVTAEQLKATLELTGETFADGDIPTAVTSASRAVDELCGRRFFTTTSDETRYFTPNGNIKLKVGDLISATSFSTDSNGDGVFEDTWTVTTDYVLEPYNAALDGKPYRYVARNPRGAFYFPVGYAQSVKVVGKFGWTTPPAQVIDATTILAARLLRRKREAPFGVVTVGMDVGAIARISRFDPDVMMLLQPFMEAPFA